MDGLITDRLATAKHYQGIVVGIIEDVEERLAPLLWDLNMFWTSPKRVKEAYGTKKAYTWLCRVVFAHLAGKHLDVRRRRGKIIEPIRSLAKILIAYDFSEMRSVDYLDKYEFQINPDETALWQRIKRSYPEPKQWEAAWADIEKHRNDSCRL